MTCTVGVVVSRSAPAAFPTLVAAADKAMYAAKRDGKNAVRFLDSDQG